ncbi:MFS transporter [Photorhabdus temperata]|uniref:MFS transporter n=1 Tax=Photorhabdus temperata TaxID=574560 RepID=UPI0021D4A1D5|nr:MFS transporter [Photorhabdus temperata]MCT8346999.1 MFS transporter [Photorhabdus temperata]
MNDTSEQTLNVAIAQVVNRDDVISCKDSVSSPKTSIAFAILAIIQATLIFTIVMVGVPLPQIATEFSLNQADLVLINAAYGLPFSGLLLFGGRLTDRYSGQKMFSFGLILFGLSSLLGAFSPSYEILVLTRFLQGIGAAMTAPASLALLKKLFTEPATFGKAMATWGGVSVLGGAVGFLASGIVTTWLSWRWMFIVPIVVAFLGVILVHKLIPASKFVIQETRPGLDLIGAILATLGISIGSYGLIMSIEHPWSSLLVMAPLIVGGLAIIVFFFVEKYVMHPLLPPGFILNPERLVGLVGMLLAAAGMGLITFLLSLYLQQIRGWSTFETSAAFIPYTLALLTLNRAAGPLVNRFGALRVMTAGLLLGTVGLAMLATLDHSVSYAFGLLPGLLILPAGASLVFSGCAVLSTSNVPLHQAGLAGGVMNTSMELGPTLGLAILMSVASTQQDVVDGYAWAFAVAGIVYLLTALGAIIVYRRSIN